MFSGAGRHGNGGSIGSATPPLRFVTVEPQHRSPLPAAGNG
jgi:hypothetical protein